MSKESIQGPLSALRNAGTVCGVCLSRGPEVLVNLFPYSEERINAVVQAVEEVCVSYRQKGKSIDQMSLGFDGGCLCLVEDGEFRLMVMHTLPDEIAESIGTSTLYAAWNAAIYVAQIEDQRHEAALSGSDYLDATAKILHKHNGLWFNNESFVVSRKPD